MTQYGYAPVYPCYSKRDKKYVIFTENYPKIQEWERQQHYVVFILKHLITKAIKWFFNTYQNIWWTFFWNDSSAELNFKNQKFIEDPAKHMWRNTFAKIANSF